MTTTLGIGLLIPLLGTMLGSAFVFFMKDDMSPRVLHGRGHRVPVADGTHTPLGYAACHSKNFYKFLMDRLDTKAFGLKKTSRIKALA